MNINAINVTNLDPQVWEAFKDKLRSDNLKVSTWTRQRIMEYLYPESHREGSNITGPFGIRRVDKMNTDTPTPVT